MTNYRGYYIDHVHFHSQSDIDEFIKRQDILEYQTRCAVFAIEGTMESSNYASEQAEKLHKEYGISWEDLEQIEIESVASA